MTLAKALVNQKIYVDLIFYKKLKEKNKSRTIGISKSNVEYFNNNIDNIKKIIWKLKKIDIFSDNLKKEKILEFEDRSNQLFSVVKNYKLYECLEKNLKKNKYFKKVIFKKKFNFNEEYNIIFNTDYSNSISKKYFNKKIIRKYNSFAYTTIIQHKKILNNTAVQIFTKRGPLAFLPISSNETSIVYSVHNPEIKKNEYIKELIKKYNFKYEIIKINKIETFKLESLSLRSYSNNKFLAFGDLLHRIHPLAGQGFNMTIRDIKIILKIIKSKKDFGMPLDHSVNMNLKKK